MVLKCNMCGYNVPVAPGKTAGICEACGASATLLKDRGELLEGLIKRAVLSMEYGEWEKARELAEQALVIDPERAEAYVAQLMAELQVSEEEALAEHRGDLSAYVSYRKALCFADPDLRARLEEYNATVLERLRQEEEERARWKKERAEQAKKWRRILLILLPLIVMLSIFFVMNIVEGNRRNNEAFERLLDLSYAIEIVNSEATAAQLRERGFRLTEGRAGQNLRDYRSLPANHGRATFRYARPSGTPVGTPMELFSVIIQERTFDGIALDFDNVEQMERHFSRTYGVEVGMRESGLYRRVLYFTLDGVDVEIRWPASPHAPATVVLRRATE